MGFEPKWLLDISINSQNIGSKQAIDVTIHALLIRINIRKNAVNPGRYTSTRPVHHNH